MKFSMNGYRENMVTDMKELRDSISCVLDVVDCEQKISLIESFDQIACNVNVLNCVSIEDDELFQDMSDKPDVPMLGNYEDD